MVMMLDQVVRCWYILHNVICPSMQKMLQKGRSDSISTAQAHILLSGCLYVAWGNAIHLSSRQSGTAEYQQHMEHKCGTF